MTAKTKIEPGDVAEIKRRVAAGESQTAVGKAFGITQPHVSRLIVGERRGNGAAGPAVSAPPAVVPWRQLTPPRHNPRRTRDPDAMVILAGSILAQGIVVPLIVRPDGDQPGMFEIVAGDRRYEAVNMLIEGREADTSFPMPVRVVELDDAGALMAALVENLAREDMTPLDEGEAFRELVDRGKTTNVIAREIGRTQRHVQSRIALVRRLIPVAYNALAAGLMTLAIAEALIQGNKVQQKGVLPRILDGTLKTEQEVRDRLRPPKPVSTEPFASPATEAPAPPPREGQEGQAEPGRPPGTGAAPPDVAAPVGPGVLRPTDALIHPAPAVPAAPAERKPTPAQRSVLERLADGERLQNSFGSVRFERADTGVSWLAAVLVDNLIKNGWVDFFAEEPFRPKIGTITPAGLAAIGRSDPPVLAATSPGGARAQSVPAAAPMPPDWPADNKTTALQVLDEVWHELEPGSTPERVRLGDRATGGRAWYVRAGAGVCRVCGCTDDDACDPPCEWVEPDLCSTCKDGVD